MRGRRGAHQAGRSRWGIAHGVETLEDLEEESGRDGWFHQHPEGGLRSAAALLRGGHDASVGWRPPPDAVWAVPLAFGSILVLCHGYLGDWNLRWYGDEAVGLRDT